jgi:hypothetical protein
VSALDEQVGGSHYKGMAIQPVEYIHKNGLGYMEGCVIKYVSRHKRKNGKEDLEKAIHFLQLLIQQEYPNEITIGNVDVEYPGYRMLNTSDILQPGDEVCLGDGIWYKAAGGFGAPVEPMSVGKFRRSTAKGSQ